MKKLLFILATVFSLPASANVIQFDYTLLNVTSDFSTLSFADGRFALNTDTGVIVQNQAEIQSDSSFPPTIADFSSQHINRLEFNDGTTMKYWDYRFDGGLVDSAAFSASRSAYLSVEYFEGGSLFLDFNDYSPVSSIPALNFTQDCAILGSCTIHVPEIGTVTHNSHVSDPTQASTYSCEWFGSCYRTFNTRVDGAINTLSVTNPSALVSSVPVPPSLWLFASGFIGLLGITRK